MRMFFIICQIPRIRDTLLWASEKNHNLLINYKRPQGLEVTITQVFLDPNLKLKLALA